MICPNCASVLETPIIVTRQATLTICPACLRSVVLDGDTCRLAEARDTVGLTQEELRRLRLQRTTARKAQAS